MIYFIIFIIFIIFVALWIISLLISAVFGAPTVYAKNEIIIQALNLAKPQKNQTMLDLGCGNARSLIIGAKYFDLKGIGIEISPFYYLLARLNVLLHGQSKSIKIYYGNLLNKKELISQADIVYLYLLENVLNNLEKFIFESIKSDAKIVTLSFPFTKHSPITTSQKPRIYIYSKD